MGARADVHAVAAALQRAQVPFALGGSGLLWALGLVDGARDWDLTTDAPLERVAAALKELTWREAPAGDPPYASAYRLAVGDVDLIGGFSVAVETGVCHLPTVVAGAWEGLPTGSPEVWAVAYRLIDRPAKADLLSAWLARHGARYDACQLLLAQPLPEQVRREVKGWPTA